MNGKKNNGRNKKIKKCRVIALLKRDEVEFLDKLAMDSLFSTGTKLSRVEIISALVSVAMLLELSASNVKSKEELVDRVMDLLNPNPERRQIPRLKKNLMVKFRKIESLQGYENGATIDVGIGGFKVDVAFMGKPLAVDQPIEITVNEPQDESKTVKAIGRVAWIREKGDGHSHEIGIMLTYIKANDKDTFLKYLTGDREAKSDAQ
ncbi:MAG: PilZ domain-containing protein [Candidatus Omnitrophica bacterium]|nr:PilZ domain-containing protein [Candidatus Omnitrophota bacterium]